MSDPIMQYEVLLAEIEGEEWPERAMTHTIVVTALHDLLAVAKAARRHLQCVHAAGCRSAYGPCTCKYGDFHEAIFRLERGDDG